MVLIKKKTEKAKAFDCGFLVWDKKPRNNMVLQQWLNTGCTKNTKGL